MKHVKNNIKSIILIILTILSISCEKNDIKTAGCDINGYWIGTWESDSELRGTFLSGVEQTNTKFNGEVSISVYSPNSNGYSTEYNGTVKNKNIKIVMDISTVDIIVEGDVSDNQTVEGNFSVPYLKMRGIFSGEMLPSSNPAIRKIFSFIPVSQGDRIHTILCVGDKLWIFVYPYEYVNYEAMLKIIITDFDGNELSTTHFPYDGISYTYDGHHIWTINGTKLLKFDINGNRVDTIDISFHTFNLAGDGQYFYFPTDNYNVLKTDLSANMVDTIAFDYAPLNELVTYKDGFLSYTSKTVFFTDKDGRIQHAYPLKQLPYITKLITNNDKIWALVEDYIEGPGFDFRYYVYEITTQ